MRVQALFVIVFIALAGCTNAYRDNYVSFAPAGQDARELPGYDASIVDIQVYGSNNLDRDILDWMTRGYVPVGQASFSASGNYLSLDDAKAQAKIVGAHAVLMSSKYSHMNSGAVPIYVPNSQTSYTTGSATVAGPYGTATGYGSATTTTHGSTPMMMPYSVALYDAAAVFLVRRKFAFGVFGEKAPDDFYKQQGNNQGVRIKVVVEGSPAFRAGLMRGDIIMSVGTVAVYTEEDVRNTVATHGPGALAVEIIRDDKRLKKTVDIVRP